MTTTPPPRTTVFMGDGIGCISGGGDVADDAASPTTVVVIDGPAVEISPSPVTVYMRNGVGCVKGGTFRMDISRGGVQMEWLGKGDEGSVNGNTHSDEK